MAKVESDEKIGVIGSKNYPYAYNGRDNVIWVLGYSSADLKNSRT